MARLELSTISVIALILAISLQQGTIVQFINFFCSSFVCVCLSCV